ncbi:MAG: carboxylesterase/lipase family protein [Promethearchaeota archaeon]|jgi:para-nitrobenzyl esterase
MKNTNIIKTTTGKIRGYVDDGLQIFKGIPYAQPPIGELRLRDTVPKEPWDGILDATEFGPIAPQPILPLSSFTDHPQSEDCLTLNIWTPACDDKKRPVMLWIHGGAFYFGGTPNPSYGGKNLSKRGELCVITINYRLGALGNLYVIDKVSNLGFLDQVTALKWVHDNIAKFGGDPENITIFGESAGSQSVCTLLSMPSAQGLFRRAITQSGGPNPRGHQPEGGIRAAEKIFSKLGIKMGDLGAFRKIPVENLLEAENEIRLENMMKKKRDFSGYPPMIDGSNVPENPLIAIAKGACKNVDLLIGRNLNESTYFTTLNPQLPKMSWDELYNYINTLVSQFEPNKKEVEEVIKIFKKSRNSPFEVMNAISTELSFGSAAINVAEAQIKHNSNTYMYLFTYPTPVQGGIYGATHALEIRFVFGTLNDIEFGIYPKKDEINTKISEQMMDSWISFARTGNPNHKTIPEWPNYDLENRHTLLFGKETTVEKDPLHTERLTLDKIKKKPINMF